MATYYPPPPSPTVWNWRNLPGKPASVQPEFMVNSRGISNKPVDPRIPLGLGIEFDTWSPYYQNQATNYLNQFNTPTGGGNGGGTYTGIYCSVKNAP